MFARFDSPADLVRTALASDLDFSALRTNLILNLSSTANQPVQNNRWLKLNASNAFENVIGGIGANTLTGNSLNNTLTGNIGKDIMIG